MQEVRDNEGHKILSEYKRSDCGSKEVTNLIKRLGHAIVFSAAHGIRRKSCNGGRLHRAPDAEIMVDAFRFIRWSDVLFSCRRCGLLF